MYLTLEYLVNSFLIGPGQKKLKPREIVTGFIRRAEGWHHSV